MAMAMITGITEGVMADLDPKEAALKRQTKLVALVIAGTMLLWMGGQQIGAELGLPLKYSLLIDLAALAGFIWAMVVTYQIWRARRA
jgi:spore maturation protein SpmA